MLSVQAVPELLKLLRYFYEKRPDLAVIAAGSLLEFELSSPQYSFPVGRVEFLHLGPMDFEEFILAAGEERLYRYLQEYNIDDSINKTAHKKLSELSRYFSIIGGMPEAVKTWREVNLSAALKINQQLVTAYNLDFNKYKGRINTQLLTKLFQKIPQTVGDKCKYSNLEADAKSLEVRKSLEQLFLAGIVTPVYHSNANGLPLAAEQKQKSFKLLYLDVGLMSAQLGFSSDKIASVIDMELINNGSIAEQFIGQHVLFSGVVNDYEPSENRELYYWIRQGRSNAEVDYLTVIDGTIYPVEVKSGAVGSLKSMHQFINEKSALCGIRFTSNEPVLEKVKVKLPNGQAEYLLLTLPHYLVGQTNRLVRSLKDKR